MAKLRFGPARVPSRRSPSEAVKILLARGFTACEIDFESGFWMGYPWAERFGKLAREANIVLSVHAPIAGFMGHLERDKKQRMAVGMLDHSAGIAKAAGAELVVFHPGFLLGRKRAATIKAVCEQLTELRERLEGKDRAVAFGVEVMGRAPMHDGSVASQGLLHGIVNCASCGRPMAVTASGPKGARFTVYYCRDPKRHGCKAPASAATAKVDALLMPELMKRLKRSGKTVKRAEDRVSILIHEWEAAEEELEAFIKYAKPSDLKEDYPRLIAQHREAVVHAKEVMYEAMNEVEAYDGMRLPEDWADMPMPDKRRILAGLVEAATIKKSSNGRWDPIEGRVSIAWR